MPRSGGRDFRDQRLKAKVNLPSDLSSLGQNAAKSGRLVWLKAEIARVVRLGPTGPTSTKEAHMFDMKNMTRLKKLDANAPEVMKPF
jgi:hypothetical protein